MKFGLHWLSYLILNLGTSRKIMFTFSYFLIFLVEVWILQQLHRSLQTLSPCWQVEALHLLPFYLFFYTIPIYFMVLNIITIFRVNFMYNIWHFHSVFLFYFWGLFILHNVKDKRNPADLDNVTVPDSKKPIREGSPI